MDASQVQRPVTPTLQQDAFFCPVHQELLSACTSERHPHRYCSAVLFWQLLYTLPIGGDLSDWCLSRVPIGDLAWTGLAWNAVRFLISIIPAGC